MPCPNPTDRAQLDPPSPVVEDAKTELGVLAFLLDEHPNRLTIPELSLAFNAGRGDFESEDAVERAIHELVGAGLLHPPDGFIAPTRAAVYFWRLEGN